MLPSSSSAAAAGAAAAAAVEASNSSAASPGSNSLLRRQSSTASRGAGPGTGGGSSSEVLDQRPGEMGGSSSSWEFRSALGEAPIARLESLDEMELGPPSPLMQQQQQATHQVRTPSFAHFSYPYV